MASANEKTSSWKINVQQVTTLEHINRLFQLSTINYCHRLLVSTSGFPEGPPQRQHRPCRRGKIDVSKYLSIYLSIYLSSHLSIYLSIHLSTI